MDETLKHRRDSSPFDIKALTYFIYNGKEKVERYEWMMTQLNTGAISNLERLIGADHTTQYLNALDIIDQLIQLQKQHNFTPEELGMAIKMINVNLPISLHLAAFLPVLMTQTNEAQKEKWLGDAMNLAIIGCYAQTELSHGSNFRELQTTATFLPHTAEFELNTPHVGATKWWSGCLGRTATHAVVHARLLLPNQNGQLKDYGVHPFIIQIRDMDTMKPLSGIKIGDIGPKMGYNSVDNGYMQFLKKRIPLDSLAGRTGHVSENGVYTAPTKENSKAAYTSMTQIRVSMVEGAMLDLARSTTVAVRYLSIRRQFSFGKGEPENEVLSYKSVQYRVLPQIAMAYALCFTSRNIRRMNQLVLAEGFKAGDALAELHATSCGLKAVSTSLAAEGTERMRRACGGHGYSAFSGLAEMSVTQVAYCTAEGDNFLMLMQTTRYLLKSLQMAQSGEELVGNVKYLQNVESKMKERCRVQSSKDWLCFNTQLQTLQVRTIFMVVRIAKKIQTYVEQGIPLAKALSECGWDVIRAAESHCYLVMLDSFVVQLNEYDMSSQLRQSLQMVASLFGLYMIENNLTELLECQFLNAVQAEQLHEQVHTLLTQIHGMAVPLVDAFNLPDFVLRSALGKFNGNPYEHLFAAASESELNHPKLDAICREKVQKLIQISKL